MKKSTTDKKSKFNLFQKITGTIVIILMFLIFTIDRILHIFLPHKEQQKFTVWVKDITNAKYTIARLIIFLVPIIIFKIIS